MKDKISNNYAICSLWIAKELESSGFKCIKKEPNINKPEFDVFFFTDSKDLRNKIKELKENK